jgi:hypothetical protein
MVWSHQEGVFFFYTSVACEAAERSCSQLTPAQMATPPCVTRLFVAPTGGKDEADWESCAAITPLDQR